MFEFSLDRFIVLVMGISLVTIGIVLHIVSREDVIRLYLKFKSPNRNVDEIIENKFNELKPKWVKNNNTINFLKLQFLILLLGFSGTMIKLADNYGLTIFVSLLLASIIISYIGWRLLWKTITDAFRIPEGLLNNRKFDIFLISISFIPLLIILAYIKIKNLEYDLNTGFILYFILTAGLYKYIEYFCGLLLPISENGICSAEELIKNIEKQTNIKEIKTCASFEKNSIQNNHEKSMHEHGQ